MKTLPICFCNSLPLSPCYWCIVHKYISVLPNAGPRQTGPALTSEVIHIAFENYSHFPNSNLSKLLIKVQYLKFTAFIKYISTAPFPSIFASAQICPSERHEGYNYSAV